MGNRSMPEAVPETTDRRRSRVFLIAMLVGLGVLALFSEPGVARPGDTKIARIIETPGKPAQFNKVIPLADRSVFLVGWQRSIEGTRCFLHRELDGVPLPGFPVFLGFGGVAPNNHDVCHSAVLLPDGNILLVGTGRARIDESGGDGLLAVVNLDGQLQKSFGNGGFVLVDRSGGSENFHDAVVLAPGVSVGPKPSGQLRGTTVGTAQDGVVQVVVNELDKAKGTLSLWLARLIGSEVSSSPELLVRLPVQTPSPEIKLSYNRVSNFLYMAHQGPKGSEGSVAQYGILKGDLGDPFGQGSGIPRIIHESGGSAHFGGGGFDGILGGANDDDRPAVEIFGHDRKREKSRVLGIEVKGSVRDLDGNGSVVYAGVSPGPGNDWEIFALKTADALNINTAFGNDGSWVATAPLVRGSLADIAVVLGSILASSRDEPDGSLQVSQGAAVGPAVGDIVAAGSVSSPGVSIPQAAYAVVEGLRDTATCIPTAQRLCLNGGRFEVTATQTTGGPEQVAGAVGLTPDTGYFWFFGQANVEVVTKVVDGCGFGNRFWVFAAGLTDVGVRLRVRDIRTGLVNEYANPLRRAFPPLQDTFAFDSCSALTAQGFEPLMVFEGREAAPVDAGDAAAVSQRFADELERELWAQEVAARWAEIRPQSRDNVLLNNSRFRIEATFRAPNQPSKPADAVKVTDETAYFWFFDQNNVEVVFKLVNACGVNGQYWFFAAGLTNVQVDITVTDTKNGKSRTYSNPQGVAFVPIQDTSAFATCP